MSRDRLWQIGQTAPGWTDNLHGLDDWAVASWVCVRVTPPFRRACSLFPLPNGGLSRLRLNLRELLDWTQQHLPDAQPLEIDWTLYWEGLRHWYEAALDGEAIRLQATGVDLIRTHAQPDGWVYLGLRPRRLYGVPMVAAVRDGEIVGVIAAMVPEAAIAGVTP